MRDWMLLAQTPRAGRFNHRFIAAPGASVPEARLQHVFKSARSHAEGTDYVAERAARVQAATQRTGEEILLLVWDELAWLDAGQKAVLRSWLAKKLSDLDTLVTRRIDWEREGEPLIVQRAELAEWESELESECAQVFAGARQRKLDRERAKAKRVKRMATWAVAAVVALTFTGITIKGWDFAEQKKQLEQKEEKARAEFINEFAALNHRPDCAQPGDPCGLLKYREDYKTYKVNNPFKLAITEIEKSMTSEEPGNLKVFIKSDKLEELVAQNEKLRKLYAAVAKASPGMASKHCADSESKTQAAVEKFCKIEFPRAPSQDENGLPVFLSEADKNKAAFLSQIAGMLQCMFGNDCGNVQPGDGFKKFDELLCSVRKVREAWKCDSPHEKLCNEIDRYIIYIKESVCQKD